MGQGYDYDSIMHYDRTAFTKNGEPTIVAIGNDKKKFGTKNHRLSEKDIIEINALYDCKSKSLKLVFWLYNHDQKQASLNWFMNALLLSIFRQILVT